MPKIQVKQIDQNSGNILSKCVYQFGRTSPVPAAGTLQLEGAGNTLAGFAVIRAGTITGASISVNTADATRSYNLDIRKNAVSVATLALSSGSTKTVTTALSIAVAASDIITAFLVRTAGAGASTFSDEFAVIEIQQ